MKQHKDKNPRFSPRLTASDALTILHAKDCEVLLHTAVGVYHTDHTDITERNLIRVKEFNEHFHPHNIKAIKCFNNLRQDDPAADYVEIDWLP